MRARRLRIGDEPLERAFGSILASDARGPGGRAVVRKGSRIEERHRAALESIAGELHLVDLDADELEQDDVAWRLARLLAGPDTEALEPEQGQARVVAQRRGVLRVRGDAVARVNGLHPLLCFTRPDGAVVVEGEEVAGVKSAALATPAHVVDEAGRAASGAVSVAAFRAARAAVVMTDRIVAAGRELMADAILRKIEWFGSRVVAVAEVPHERSAIERALRDALAAGAEIILVSGANALDPLDAPFVALEAAGGRVERTGVPAHPGSMVWVGSIDARPLLGIATCAGFGKNTALDLLLARVLSGEDAPSAADALGACGLVEGDAGALWFPPYERGARPVVAALAK